MQEGFGFSHCTTCKAQFHLRVESFEDNSWHKLKFRLFVAGDVLLVFFVVQTVSLSLVFLLLRDTSGSYTVKRYNDSICMCGVYFGNFIYALNLSSSEEGPIHLGINASLIWNIAY